MKIEKKIKNIIWGIIYALPLILCVLSVYRTGDYTIYSTIFNEFNFSFISNSLHELEQIIDITFNSTLISIVSYYISVELVRIFYEFIVFIPNVARKFLGVFMKNKNRKKFFV